MLRYRLITVVLVGLLAFVPVPGQARSSTERPATKVATHAINSLATDLYPKLKKGDDNLFFSPYSISSALAMAYAGARAETAAQMARALHFTGDRENLDTEFGVLRQSLADSGDQRGCRLDVANALWAQKGFPFLPEFRALILDAYRGKFTQVDFAKEPEASRKTINKAVEDQTQGKIMDLMPEGSINQLTKMVLTNAIYFKGQWASTFKENETQAGEFTLLDGSKIQAPMMHRTGRYGYAEVNGVQILELHYMCHEFSMIVFLPKESAGLRQFEQSLSLERLYSLAGKLQQTEVKVSVPKFKIEPPSYQLGSILASMGMPEAFSSKADFSGIDGRQDLFLQAALHKTFINVDEAGTEAAAATAVHIAASSRPNENPPVFRADHPFLFVIKHNPSQCILFMGRLTKP